MSEEINNFMKYNIRVIKLQGKRAVAPHHAAKAMCLMSEVIYFFTI